MEDNGGGSTEQNWMETIGLQPMIHWQQKNISK